MGCILLVTVTKVEAQTVLDVFPAAAGKAWERRPIDGKTYYALGQVGGADLLMVQFEMGTVGPGAALLTTRNTIDDLTPTAVIMVGIAFGANPDKQQLGDILVSKQIQVYEPQKVKAGRRPIPRGDRVTASPRLLNKFRSGDLDWKGAAVRALRPGAVWREVD